MGKYEWVNIEAFLFVDIFNPVIAILMKEKAEM